METSAMELKLGMANQTIGAILLGLVVASLFFGVSCLQTYLYYHRFRGDSLLHRIAVGTLWGLGCLELALICHAVYFYLISNFGDLESSAKIIWSVKLELLLGVVMVLVVQSLYAYRVWLLSGFHHGVLGYVVASVVAGGFVIGIVLVYCVYTASRFDELHDISWAVTSSLAAATIIDFVIALSMCYYLRQSKGTESRLNSRISLIMQYTLSSGALTSFVSLCTIFTYTLLPHSLVYLGFQFVLMQVYVVSFLAMINARSHAESSETSSHATRGLSRSASTPIVIRLASTRTTVRDGRIRDTDVESGQTVINTENSVALSPSASAAATWNEKDKAFVKL